jgi:3-deoxy-D-manno-octulosonate 8-phosphate phosphatase (KDO 8-P phosphatase)
VKDEALARRCRALKLVLTDVDGVLTDGRIVLTGAGDELKSFHARDGLAVALLRQAGLHSGVLSGRRSPTVERRAAELGMDIVRQGAREKLPVFEALLAEQGLEAHEVAFIGDDLADVPVMRAAGLSAAPCDAPFEVRNQAFMSLTLAGGAGCFREFVEAILRARGDWEAVVAALAGPDVAL